MITNNIASESLALSNAMRVIATRLAPCPSTGGGVHPWLFCAALALRQTKHTETTACRAIRCAVENCGRQVPDREIEDAVQNAFNSKNRAIIPAWPSKNPALIAEIASNGVTLDELRQRSPVDVATTTTDEIIEALFPGDPANVLICAGTDQKNAATRRKLDYRGAWEAHSFIVPNPMLAFRGTNKSGRRSPRCLANTGARRFLVVESDPAKWQELLRTEQEHFGSEENYIAAKKDEAAAVLWHLAKRAPKAPLTLVVDSAGKSIHGWFYVANQTDEWCKKFFRYAVALGADRMLWTRCQLVRMPNGARDNGKRQVVLFFNPNYTEVQ